MAVHSWIAFKPRGAAEYTRYEVMGWGVDRGAPALRVNRTGPDNYWFGSRPDLLVDRRGDGVDAIIAKVETAVGRLSVSGDLSHLARPEQQYLRRLRRPRRP